MLVARIQARPGCEDTVARALAEVAAAVAAFVAAVDGCLARPVEIVTLHECSALVRR